MPTKGATGLTRLPPPSAESEHLISFKSAGRASANPCHRVMAHKYGAVFNDGLGFPPPGTRTYDPDYFFRSTSCRGPSRFRVDAVACGPGTKACVSRLMGKPVFPSITIGSTMHPVCKSTRSTPQPFLLTWRRPQAKSMIRTGDKSRLLSVTRYSSRLEPPDPEVFFNRPASMRSFNLRVSIVGEISRLSRNCSNLVEPCKASRSISKLHHSPT